MSSRCRVNQFLRPYTPAPVVRGNRRTPSSSDPLSLTGPRSCGICTERGAVKINYVAMLLLNLFLLFELKMLPRNYSCIVGSFAKNTDPEQLNVGQKNICYGRESNPRHLAQQYIANASTVPSIIVRV